MRKLIKKVFDGLYIGFLIALVLFGGTYQFFIEMKRIDLIHDKIGIWKPWYDVSGARANIAAQVTGVPLDGQAITNFEIKTPGHTSYRIWFSWINNSCSLTGFDLNPFSVGIKVCDPKDCTFQYLESFE